MSEYQLAQLNIGQAKDEMDTETMSGFASKLDEINALAEQAPGFIWRLQTEDGDATSIRMFDDPLLLVNMSVWQDVESLQHYVYKTVHVDLLRDRDAWFNKMKELHQVLWWVVAGEKPTVDQALERLNILRDKGPGESAFTFAKPFSSPT